MNNQEKKLNIQLSDLHLPELWRRTRRGVIYAAVLVVFLSLQNVVFSHITVFGIHSMFMPALVAACALMEGAERGGYFGLAAGILCDLFYASQSMLFTLLFPILGFLIGLLADFYLNRRFFCYAIFAALALFISAVAQIFSLLLAGQSAGRLWLIAVGQTLWSLPFIVPCYYVCKLIPRRSGGDVPSPY